MKLRPFHVVINAADVYTHSVIVMARPNHHGEALEEALRVLDLNFNHVVSASVTPEREN